MIPTLLGITLLVFTVSRFAPGGPYEAALQAATSGGQEGSKGSGDDKGGNLSEELKEELEEQYNFDKILIVAYGQWLGVAPREDLKTKAEFGGKSIVKGYDRSTEARFILRSVDRLVSVQIKYNDDKTAELVSFKYKDGEGDPVKDGWALRIESPEDRKERWARRENSTAERCPNNYYFRVVAYKERFSGLIQGELGNSTVYGDPVSSLIADRVPISLYFGLLSTIIIYVICIPLGVFKAIKHGSIGDNLSSITIFVGYAIPGYALGAIMVVFLGARLGMFPIFGLTSESFADMSTWGQIKDIAHHTVLPLICFVVGGFAFLTMMMKNNLMENLSSDYVRTAMAKGVTFRKAVTKHAFRNSFIPIATGLGGLISLFVSGSMLIERVFDIQGFGLLQFQAVQAVDTNVIMGTLTISALLMLLGNILSDVIVAFVDPRIKFN